MLVAELYYQDFNLLSLRYRHNIKISLNYPHRFELRSLFNRHLQSIVSCVMDLKYNYSDYDLVEQNANILTDLFAQLQCVVIIGMWDMDNPQNLIASLDHQKYRRYWMFLLQLLIRILSTLICTALKEQLSLMISWWNGNACSCDLMFFHF
jgi:hypothetical protein